MDLILSEHASFDIQSEKILFMLNKSFHKTFNSDYLQSCLYRDFYHYSPFLVSDFEKNTKLNWYDAITYSEINMFWLLEMIVTNDYKYKIEFYRTNKNKLNQFITLNILYLLDMQSLLDQYINFKFSLLLDQSL